jgi:hypothetical protein
MMMASPAHAATQPAPPRTWTVGLEARCLTMLASNFGYVRAVRTVAQNRVLYTYILRNGGTPCRTLVRFRDRMNNQER